MVFTALTIPSNYLMITYPMADFEGKSLRPSIIIPRLKKILPRIQEESEIVYKNLSNDKYYNITAPIPTLNELIEALRNEYENEEIDPHWISTFKWFEESEEFKDRTNVVFNGLNYTNLVEKIPREKIKRLYSNENGRLMFSVSRIEKYAQCPFSYYVQYGLKAKDRKVYEFSAPDLGSFMHDILDKFTNKIRNENIPNMKTSHVVQRQNIHRQGTKMYEDRKAQLLAKGKYGPAYVTISDKEIVDLVNKYKGTGRIRLNKNNRWDNKETIIDNDKIVGVVVNDINGKAVETSVFKIHYGKDGVHVVPDYPSKKGSD